jgi:uncharacterized protein YjbI with pentapeptide repeats
VARDKIVFWLIGASNTLVGMLWIPGVIEALAALIIFGKGASKVRTTSPATDPPRSAPLQGSEGTRERDAPSKLAAPDELPDFAKKADDLEAIKKAVDDAASVSGGLWLSYLFVLFYLAVAAGAVTHADLFFERAVKLPFLGIELPLVAFFLLAPILFVIVHAYTLVHLVMLTDKAKRYHQALYAQIEDANGEETERRKATRDKLRRQLPSNIFIQFLAGPSDLRESAFGLLLRGIAWITLVVAPVLLLLTIQIQFLPYQSGLVAWTQRIALLFDLALVWWLWRKVLAGGESDTTAPRTSLPRFRQARRRKRVAVGIGLLFSLIAVTFSCAIATFPGEWQEDLLAKWDKRMWVVTVHNALFSAEPDKVTHRRWPFSNTLVLPGLNVYEGLSIDDPAKAKWRDFVFRPLGRDLKGAIFTFASLPKVDFTGAHFEGARLSHTQLQGASLEAAYLQGASLEAAQLQGASLDSAQLQGARLSGARLQGASLDQARLDGALLNGAQLQGVSFSGAILKAADLSNAYLWRSNQVSRRAPPKARSPTVLSAIRMVGDDKAWENRAWDEEAYEKLRTSLQSLPSGSLRQQALDRIAVLDCDDKTLQSCDPDPAATLPKEATDWKSAVMDSLAKVQPYQKALAESLKALFCPGDKSEALVVRNVAQFRLLQQAGPAASALITELLKEKSSDCPVVASLTDSDRATLLSIQQDINSLQELGLENPR